MDPKTRTGKGMLIALKTQCNHFEPKAALASSKYPEAGNWLVSMMKAFKVTGKNYHNSYRKPSMNPGEVIEGERGLRKK